MLPTPPVFANEEMDAVRMDQAIQFFHRQPRDRIAGDQGGVRGRHHATRERHNCVTHTARSATVADHHDPGGRGHILSAG